MLHRPFGCAGCAVALEMTLNIHSTAIRKGRKFDQVLEGAREVFLADGFGAANMDHVAKASGVSKATLYSYFADKESLFIAVVQTICAHQAEQAMQHIDQSAPPGDVLSSAARHFVGVYDIRIWATNFPHLRGRGGSFSPTLASRFIKAGRWSCVKRSVNIYTMRQPRAY